jgi:DNA-binding response OmpR family regulator
VWFLIVNHGEHRLETERRGLRSVSAKRPRPRVTPDWVGEGEMDCKVLVMDDDAALLRLMSLAFKAEGFSTVCADNGRQGVRMAAAHRPDLVVTDIVMPDVEGIGAIRELKAAPRAPKVIAISGAGRGRGSDYLSWARHLGADAVLAKPFRMSELMQISKALVAADHSHKAQARG